MPGEEGKWLPVGDPPGKPRERSLNLNNTIFTVTAPRYAYMQNLSQIRDVACSTCCMVLHGFLMDSLLNELL